MLTEIMFRIPGPSWFYDAREHITHCFRSTMWSFSIWTIALWATDRHFVGKLCPCISVALTLYLSQSTGATWRTILTLASLELYSPTFGDIKVPADDYCLYHCFNYVMSNGSSPLTENYARRLQGKYIVAFGKTSYSSRRTA